jgi:hypothetical protein
MTGLFWQKPLTVVLAELHASPEGLRSEDATARLTHYRPNLLTIQRQRALIIESLARCRTPLVLLRRFNTIV